MIETNDFDSRKLPGGNAMFPTTGDAKRDEELGRQFMRREALLAEGLCPNGDGRLIEDSPTRRHCETCRFVQERFVMGAG
jgi:hypothetical protein